MLVHAVTVTFLICALISSIGIIEILILNSLGINLIASASPENMTAAANTLHIALLFGIIFLQPIVFFIFFTKLLDKLVQVRVVAPAQKESPLSPRNLELRENFYRNSKSEDFGVKHEKRSIAEVKITGVNPQGMATGAQDDRLDNVIRRLKAIRATDLVHGIQRLRGSKTHFVLLATTAIGLPVAILSQNLLACFAALTLFSVIWFGSQLFIYLVFIGQKFENSILLQKLEQVVAKDLQQIEEIILKVQNGAISRRESPHQLFLPGRPEFYEAFVSNLFQESIPISGKTVVEFKQVLRMRESRIMDGLTSSQANIHRSISRELSRSLETRTNRYYFQSSDYFYFLRLRHRSLQRFTDWCPIL